MELEDSPPERCNRFQTIQNYSYRSETSHNAQYTSNNARSVRVRHHQPRVICHPTRRIECLKHQSRPACPEVKSGSTSVVITFIIIVVISSKVAIPALYSNAAPPSGVSLRRTTNNSPSPTMAAPPAPQHRPDLLNHPPHAPLPAPPAALGAPNHRPSRPSDIA